MTNSNEIYVIEDEPKIAKLLQDYLQREGFVVTVVGDGISALDQIKSVVPALVILDLMLPGKDGLAVCREVRQFSDVPIIMLTAKVDEIDRLLGLELGADDYICKPFSPREVVARVRAILRRVQINTQLQGGDTLAYRGITLHIDRFQCLVSDHSIELTAVEFRLLRALMSRPGRVFSRDQLMGESYSDHRVVSDRTIDSHIKNLRKKLAVGDNSEELIHSIYGVGYKME